MTVRVIFTGAELMELVAPSRQNLSTPSSRAKKETLLFLLLSMMVWFELNMREHSIHEGLQVFLDSLHPLQGVCAYLVIPANPDC